MSQTKKYDKPIGNELSKELAKTLVLLLIEHPDGHFHCDICYSYFNVRSRYGNKHYILYNYRCIKQNGCCSDCHADGLPVHKQWKRKLGLKYGKPNRKPA